MRDFFLFTDKLIVFIVRNITSFLLVLVTIIVFLEVILRYVLKIPIGGLGEVPILSMILCVWLASSLNSRRDSHISIKIIDIIIKNQEICKYIKLIIRLLNILTISVFLVLSWDYLKYSKESGDISPGLRLPQWWLILTVFISSMLMLFYAINSFDKDIKKIKEIK